MTHFWDFVGLFVMFLGVILGLYFVYLYLKTKNRIWDVLSLVSMILLDLLSAYIHHNLGSEVLIMIPICTAIILFVLGVGTRLIQPAKY